MLGSSTVWKSTVKSSKIGNLLRIGVLFNCGVVVQQRIPAGTPCITFSSHNRQTDPKNLSIYFENGHLRAIHFWYILSSFLEIAREVFRLLDFCRPRRRSFFSVLFWLTSIHVKTFPGFLISFIDRSLKSAFYVWSCSWLCHCSVDARKLPEYSLHGVNFFFFWHVVDYFFFFWVSPHRD